MSAHRITGLHRGGLPFQIAQLKIGESMLVECARARLGAIRDRVNLASKAKALAHMQWTCQSLHCIDMHAPDQETYAVRITRVADRVPPTE